MSSPAGATTTNRGRTYTWHDEIFDSVTTIIGGGVPKPALKPWGEKLVATTAVDKLNQWETMDRDDAIDWLKRSPFRETDRAAVQGSHIHDWAEKHVLGLPVAVEDAPEIQRPYLDGFLRFIAEWHPEYEMTEASVFSRRYRYAGTLDAIVTLDGIGRLLVDYKTGKGVYGEVGLQLAAYRYAEFVGLPDGSEAPMPKVDGAAVLHLTPTGYRLIPVQADETAWRYFLYAQQVRLFCVDHASTVLGQPLIPAQEGAVA